MKLSLLACIGASMVSVSTAQSTSGSLTASDSVIDSEINADDYFDLGSACSPSQIDDMQKALNTADVIDICGADPDTVPTWGGIADLPICDDKKCLEYITPIVESLPTCTVEGFTVQEAFEQIAKVCDYAEENGSPRTDGFNHALVAAVFASLWALQASM